MIAAQESEILITLRERDNSFTVITKKKSQTITHGACDLVYHKKEEYKGEEDKDLLPFLPCTFHVFTTKYLPDMKVESSGR